MTKKAETARPAGRIRRYTYLLAYYLRALLGQKRPFLGGIKLTHECNLTCTACPFWKREQDPLTFERAVSCMNALHDWGVRILIVEGGEPFLWRDGQRDISNIVEWARSRFFCVGITTNGTFPIGTDANVVWVSIDGLRETHDRLRGPSWEKIVENIRTSSHPNIYAHVTINTANRDEIPDLVEFLAPLVKGITFQFHYPYEEPDELFLPIEQRSEVLDQLIKQKKQGLPIADSYACLRTLKDNSWKCRPWMVASVDPDGRTTRGCYLKDRGAISCDKCGFAAHTEISLAYGWNPGAIMAGHRIFGIP